MNRSKLTRRAFLWGAGGVCLSLPWLEEFASPAHASDIDSLPRYLSVFLPLGIPLAATESGERTGLASESLLPLAPLADRMSIYRGIDYVHSSNHRMKNNVFTGWKPHKVGETGEWFARGDSLDQVIMSAFRQGYPGQSFNNMHVGIVARNKGDQIFKIAHSWKNGGAQYEATVDDPALIFAQITGDARSPEEARRYTSILDVVRESHHDLLSPRSRLGASSKARVNDYLEELREVERRVQASSELTCDVGENPPDAPDTTGGNWWRNGPDVLGLMVDLMVLGMQCDPTIRFGTVGLGAASESFPVADEINGGSYGAHEQVHHGNKEHLFGKIAAAQMKLFMVLLDKLASTPDGPLGDMLSNTMVLLGSELGDHSQNHNIHNVFHVVAGLDSRLNHGRYITREHTHVDLYTTALRAFGIDQLHGDPELFNDTVAGLLGDVPDRVG